MATCSSCVSSYQTCVTNNPYNWQSCLNTYNSCLGGCSWNKAEPKAEVKPVAAVAKAEPKAMYSNCYSCVPTYQECIQTNQYNWGDCIDNYNDCIFDCRPYVMATCSSCVSNYQTCVTNNPYNW